MIEYYKKAVFENYANFRGRAQRSEYWYFILAQIVFFSIFVGTGSLVDSFLDNAEKVFL